MSKKLIAGLGVVAGLAVAMAPVATFATRAANTSDQHTDELVVTVLPSCTFGSTKKGTTSPYPSGITHDDALTTRTGYVADGDASTPSTRGATAWNTTQTAETSGSVHSTDEGGHNADDVASTGYGYQGENFVEEDGGLTSANYATLKNASEHTVHRSMLAGVSTTTFAQTTMWVVCNNGDGYSITATANPLTNGTAAEDIAVTAETISESTTASTSGYNGSVTVTEMSKDADVTAAAETLIAHKAGVSAEAGDSLTVTYGMSIKTSQKADTYAGKVVYKLYKGVNS